LGAVGGGSAFGIAALAPPDAPASTAAPATGAALLLPARGALGTRELPEPAPSPPLQLALAPSVQTSSSERTAQRLPILDLELANRR
jgi:hypothetical protein